MITKEIIIIEDFIRELSVWQQEIEVEANHFVVPQVLGIPDDIFFFHFKNGVSTAYRAQDERGNLSEHYIRLVKKENFSEWMYHKVKPIVEEIKDTTQQVIDSQLKLEIKSLKKIRKDIIDIWSGYLYGVNVPRFKEKGLFSPSSEIEKNNLFWANKIRVLTEGIYDYVENSLKKTLAPTFEKYHVPLSHFSNLTTSEIITVLSDNKPVSNQAKEYIIDQKGTHEINLKDYLRFNNYGIQPEEIVNNMGELKGVVACTGGLTKVRGRVKIVRKSDITNIKDFDEGNILVSMATSPNFVPLMKKAAAIVTDGGGLTSHATIVSRELNKPCVVKTKVATQFLKDGDEIEVDLISGLVIKI